MKKIITLFVLCLIYQFGYSQAWRNLDSVPAGVNFARTGAFSINGKGYVFGGHYETKAWSYDTLTNAWSQINDYPAPTTDGVVACSLNGIGYAGTGVQYSTRTNNFFKYDPGTGNWSSLPNFPGGARAYAVMFALDGKIYIGGGFDNSAYNDFYAYDPVVGTWGPAIQPFPGIATVTDVAFVVGDKAYVGTGAVYTGNTPSVRKSFWEYDTISKIWTPIADLPGRARAEASAFSTCDKGYVGLGYINSTRDTLAADFWQYDPVKDHWKQIANYGGAFGTAAFAFAVGKTGYVGGGYPPSGGPDLHALWSYTETVTPAFTAAGSFSSTNICAGQTVPFTDTSNYSPINWLWTFAGGIPHTSSLQNPTIEYDTAGTYDVTLSAWNGCDSAAKTLTQYITVGAGGILNISANPPSICGGQNSTLTITAGSGNYIWTNALGLNDTTGSLLIVSPDTTTVYTATTPGSGCGATGQVTVTVADNTVGGHVSAVRDTICQGTPGNISLTGNSSNTIQWQSSTDDVTFTDIIHDTLTSFKTTPLQQTTWYYANVGTGNCSAVSDTLRLYVPPALTASFYYTQTGSFSLSFNSDSSVGSIRSYHWDFGDGQTSNEQNPSHTYTKDSTYYVCLTLYDGSNCSYTFCRYSSVTDAVQTISAEGDWLIYPNPFNEQLIVSPARAGQLTVGNKIQSVEMYDVPGRVVLNKDLGNTTNTSLRLDVSSLAKGMYFVMLRTANADYVQKVVKQ